MGLTAATCNRPADFVTSHLGGPAVRLYGDGADGTWNVVILGDGFTADPASISAYQAAADMVKDELLAAYPFNALSSALTIYRVDVLSDAAGIDVPRECGSVTAAMIDRAQKSPHNALETQWCAATNASPDPAYRFLSSASTYVADFPAAAGVAPDATIVLVNDWMFGATAYSQPNVVYASIQRNLIGDSKPDGPPHVPTLLSFPSVVVHEVGHLEPFLLLDEYEGWGQLPTTLESDVDDSPNLSLKLPAATPVKWADLTDPLQPGTPLPSDCTATSPPDAGLYKGGVGYSDGVYHPSCACRMNIFTHPTFCVVCRRQILTKLAPKQAAATTASGAGDIRFMLDAIRLPGGVASVPNWYWMDYTIAIGATSMSGRWPGTNGRLLRLSRDQKAAVVGELLAAIPPPASPAAGTIAYTLRSQPLPGYDPASATILAQGTRPITQAELVTGIIAVNEPGHRLTLGLVVP
jgi:hypothetical protein